MVNCEIRQQAARAGVKLWRIADRLGIADSGFSRKLRHELPQEEKERVLKIISELAGEVK